MSTASDRVLEQPAFLERSTVGYRRPIQKIQPADGAAARRFNVIARADERLRKAGNAGVALIAVGEELAPALADRCALHITRGVQMNMRDLPLHTDSVSVHRLTRSVPNGHPLRECIDRRDSMLVSTTAPAMLRALLGSPAEPIDRGCMRVLLAPIVDGRRCYGAITLLRSFARAPWEAADLLVAEVVANRLAHRLSASGARFGRT